MENQVPNRSDRPVVATTASNTPHQPKKANAPSLGKRKKMLGDSRKVVTCRKRDTGKRPFSPQSGRNWFTTTRKAMR